MLRHRGFTLIELLVVVSIIGVLSSVVLSSLNSARFNAIDTADKEDAHQLAQAVNTYFIDTGTMPHVSAFTNGTINGTLSELQPLVPGYMPQLPPQPPSSQYGGVSDYWIMITSPDFNPHTQQLANVTYGCSESKSTCFCMKANSMVITLYLQDANNVDSTSLLKWEDDPTFALGAGDVVTYPVGLYTDPHNPCYDSSS